MSFKPGDRVQWSSQANGITKVKQGEIVAVIEAGQHMNITSQGFLWEECDLSPIEGGGLPRNHESYLVRVSPERGNAAAKVYWPRVKGLEKVEEA